MVIGLEVVRHAAAYRDLPTAYSKGISLQGLYSPNGGVYDPNICLGEYVLPK